MKSGYEYGYFTAGAGRARWHRMTLAERYRLWKRRRTQWDLQNVKQW